jgi:outer membrane protein assembly factor BamE (lipoprotein component of BamABCDE complex)
MRRPVLAVAVALSLGACAPTYTTHGFTPQLAELDEIAAGVDTRGSVLRKLGQPSAPGAFDADSWYYVASKVERLAFYRPQVVERTVVAVSFDEAGLVREVNRYGLEDGRVVDLATDTTPTFGRELTVVQQMFGNFGRFDTATLTGQPGGGLPGGSRRRGGL